MDHLFGANFADSGITQLFFTDYFQFVFILLCKFYTIMVCPNKYKFDGHCMVIDSFIGHQLKVTEWNIFS
uniref:Uncharacterized protein n=1 Tax=Acrobeloides nanus TaxID=290746 RepID=A0A914CNW2_9BILA